MTIKENGEGLYSVDSSKVNEHIHCRGYGSFPIDKKCEFQVGDELYIAPTAKWFRYIRFNSLTEFMKSGISGNEDEDKRIPIAIEVQCKRKSMVWPEKKILYFGMLCPNVICRNEDNKTAIIRTKTDKYDKVYEAARLCKGRAIEYWETFKGKCLKVVDTKEARVDFGPIHSRLFREEDYKTITIPIFDFVDYDERSLIFRSYYNPVYCYDNFEIYRDITTHLYGIRDNLGRTLFSPIFNAILWGDNKETDIGPEITHGETHNVKEGEIIEYVRFFKNQKKAMLRIEELYKMEDILNSKA